MSVTMGIMPFAGLLLLMGTASVTTVGLDTSEKNVVIDDVAQISITPPTTEPDSESDLVMNEVPEDDLPKHWEGKDYLAITHHRGSMFGDLRAADPNPDCISKNLTCDSPFDPKCCSAPNKTKCKNDPSLGFPVCQDCTPNSGDQCSVSKPCCDPYACRKGTCTRCSLTGQSCSRKKPCCLNNKCVNKKCNSCGSTGFTCGADSGCCAGKQCVFFRDTTGRNVITCQKCTGTKKGDPCAFNTNQCCKPMYCVPDNPKDLNSTGKCGTRQEQFNKQYGSRNCHKRNQPCDFIDDRSIKGGTCCQTGGDNICSYNHDVGFVTCVKCVKQVGGMCAAEETPCCAGLKCQNRKCSKCQQLKQKCGPKSGCCPNFHCVKGKCAHCRGEGFLCGKGIPSAVCCPGLQCFDNKDITGRSVTTCETCEGKKVGDECSQEFNRCCQPLVCLSNDPMDPTGDGKCDTQANKDKRDAMMATMTTTVPPPTTPTSAPPRCEKEHYTCDLPGDKQCCQKPQKTVCTYEYYRGHSYAQCTLCNDTQGARCNAFTRPCCDGQKCMYPKCVKCGKVGDSCKKNDDCCLAAKCKSSKCVKCGGYGFTCKKDGDCCPKYQCFPRKDGDRQLMLCLTFSGTRPGDSCNEYNKCKKPLSCVVDPMDEYGNGKCQFVASTTTPPPGTTTPPQTTTPAAATTAAAMMG